MVDLGDKANAWPAVLVHLSEVLHALQIGWQVLSLFFGGLLADGVGFVDIINAEDLNIVGALVVGGDVECSGGGGESKEGEQLHEIDI